MLLLRVSVHLLEFCLMLKLNPHAKGLFSQEEEQIMNFHLSSLEYASGCSLSQLSSCHWDETDDVSQFDGGQITVPQGFSSILSKLAEGLDIRYDCQVMAGACQFGVLCMVKMLVAYPLEEINLSFCWLLVIFWTVDRISRLPVFSESVNDSHTIVRVHRRQTSLPVV